nr:immunoglobulin light chain junction region [Macaca mulatta]
CQQVYGHPIAF